MYRYRRYRFFCNGLDTMSDRSLVVEKSTSLVVWLHGLGDTPDGWFAQCRSFARKLPNTSFFCPCAPIAPVTCNGGSRMTSWMDLLEIPIKPTSPDNGKFQEESIKKICDFIDEKRKSLGGLSASRVVVAGFSQGAALALAVASRYEEPLKGCVVLSGWALPHQHIGSKLKKRRDVSSETKFFVGHGESDSVVMTSCGTNVNAILSQCGCKPTFKTYPGMAHSSCPEEMRDVLKFFSECFASSS